MLNIRKLPIYFIFLFFAGCTIRWPPAPSESPVRVKATVFPRAGVAIQVDLDPIPYSERLMARRHRPTERPFPFPMPIFRMDPGIRWHPHMGHPFMGSYFHFSLRMFGTMETSAKPFLRTSTWASPSPQIHWIGGQTETFFGYLPPLQLAIPSPVFVYETATE